MRDYIELGPTPSGEDCAQVGTQDYHIKSRKELRAYKNQLERMCPGSTFTIKAFPHDFGTYHEVCVVFDDENEEQVEKAYKANMDMPEFWDKEARIELGLGNNCGITNPYLDQIKIVE